MTAYFMDEYELVLKEKLTYEGKPVELSTVFTTPEARLPTYSTVLFFEDGTQRELRRHRDKRDAVRFHVSIADVIDAKQTLPLL